MTSPARGLFGPMQRKAHINEKEVGAALLSLDAFANFAQGLHIELVTYYQVTMHCVRKMSSRSPRIMSSLRLLKDRCDALGVTLVPCTYLLCSTYGQTSCQGNAKGCLGHPDPRHLPVWRPEEDIRCTILRTENSVQYQGLLPARTGPTRFNSTGSKSAYF